MVAGAGAVTSGKSVLVAPGPGEPGGGGARPAPTQPAVRRIKKSPTMRVAGVSKRAPRDREEQCNAFYRTAAEWSCAQGQAIWPSANPPGAVTSQFFARHGCAGRIAATGRALLSGLPPTSLVAVPRFRKSFS